MQIKIAANRLKKIFLPALACFLVSHTSFAQWVAYTFNPSAAYQASYGLNTNAGNNSTNISPNGWGVGFNNNALAISNTNSWSSSSSRAVYVLYFSPSTNIPNFITALPPIFYTYANTTATIATNSNNSPNFYTTNLPGLVFTNTNAVNLDATANTNVWYFNRTKFGNSFYMAGQFTASSSNSNAVGVFNSICVGYTTSSIGTNNWWTTNTNGALTNLFGFGTNPLPPVLQLKISSLSLTSTTNSLSATNQQLVLPLTIALDLTKTLNNNIGTNASNYSSNMIAISNCLPLLIRSNGTFKTTTN